MEGYFTAKYSRIVTVSFFVLLVGLAAAALVLPDAEVSKEERRHYAQSPELTWETVADGSYMSDLEEYLLDQFPARDWFRRLKTEVETELLGKRDANGYVCLDDGIYELDTNWKESNVTRAAKEFAELQAEYFTEADVYYALIPDKSYFLPKENYPVAEDGFTYEQMQKYLTDAVYIDLYPYLEVSDYYRTDLHWKQEEILDVAEVLCDTMQAGENELPRGGTQRETEDEPVPNKAYDTELISDEFYGGYAGGSAYEVKPDTLYAVTDEVIGSAVVYDYETQQNVSVYAPEKLDGTDPYDYFLWGARALLTIQNPQCQNGKRLLLFRDSFGSSIAPLLISSYEEITLVDLRYVSADYLPELINMADYEDVLFLYSQRVLRHSDSMRF